MRDRTADAIYGHLVGDAFGVPYEFRAPDQLPEGLDWGARGTHNQPPGTWSDDGALMLCLLASLHDRSGFDPADVGRRFVAWEDEGYMAAAGLVFDVGDTTRRAIERLRRGVPPLEAGPATENDNGNGGLMRILPLAMWARAEPLGRFVRLMHDGSRLTHGHPCSQVCCAVYGLLVRHLAHGGDRATAWETALTTAEHEYQRNAAFGESFLRETERIRGFAPCAGSGFVVDCLCSAWEAVRDTPNFADAVRRAVRFGNDTDTTAAVAGSLAGVIFGLDAIPRAWRDSLRLSGDQRKLIAAFSDSVAARGQSTAADPDRPIL